MLHTCHFAHIMYSISKGSIPKVKVTVKEILIEIAKLPVIGVVLPNYTPTRMYDSTYFFTLLPTYLLWSLDFCQSDRWVMTFEYSVNLHLVSCWVSYILKSYLYFSGKKCLNSSNLPACTPLFNICTFCLSQRVEFELQKLLVEDETESEEMIRFTT